MTKFVKSGTYFVPSSEESHQIHKVLPAKTFIITPHPDLGLVLDPVDSFSLPKKLYGDVTKNADRILNTFSMRPSSTGVMLSGEKGSGKTLLAKHLCMEGAKKGIPTVLINFNWSGDNFMKLVQSITQPCIFLFDEFEKVYDVDDQKEILTMLDGVFASKKLFIFTCNDKYGVDTHLLNRPGRIFYYMEYKGLDIAFIREYCGDNMQNKEHIDQMIMLSRLFDNFNFDMLSAVVEEMNRYGETPQDAVKILNVRPEFSSKQFFDAVIFDGKKKMINHNPVVKINPAVNHIDITYRASNRSEWQTIKFQLKHLAEVDQATGGFTYKMGDLTLKLSQQKTEVMDYSMLL